MKRARLIGVSVLFSSALFVFVASTYSQLGLLGVGNVGKAAPITRTYTSGSSATETVPSGGYTQLIIEGYGPGGNGGNKTGVSCADGFGGGGGAYFKKTIALVS